MGFLARASRTRPEAKTELGDRLRAGTDRRWSMGTGCPGPAREAARGGGAGKRREAGGVWQEFPPRAASSLHQARLDSVAHRREAPQRTRLHLEPGAPTEGPRQQNEGAGSTP